MQSQLVRSRRLEDVHNTLLEIAHALDGIGDKNACILNCMQPHRPDFYLQLERDFGVRVLPCYPSDGIKATIRKAMLGVSGLIVIDHYNELPSLFARIGEQSMAALYIIKRSMLAGVSEFTQMSAAEITARVKEDSAHLVYQVDEDSAEEDGLVLELLSVGTDCPEALREAVAIN